MSHFLGKINPAQIVGAVIELLFITRQWSCLKVISVFEMKNDNILCCIADGVERGMFPCLTTLRSKFNEGNSFLHKLLKANIYPERIE